MRDLWNVEAAVSDLGIQVPHWIDQDITGQNVAAILQGGCASGAYMPAVTYHEARNTMNDHGDDVLDYIQDTYGERLPTKPADDESWSGIAVFYLSVAVELWAGSVEDEIIAAAEEAEEAEEADSEE